MIGKYRCRCSRKVCQARRTIAKHPDEYVRPKRCRSCGKGRLRVDKYRNTGREQRKCGTCKPDLTGCCGYSFPHAKGRGWCDSNPALSMDDLAAREAWA